MFPLTLALLNFCYTILYLYLKTILFAVCVAQVTCEEGKAVKKSHQFPPAHLVPHSILHLYPPLVLHNLLPYDIDYSLEKSDPETIVHGDNAALSNADLEASPRINIQVSPYKGQNNHFTTNLHCM